MSNQKRRILIIDDNEDAAEAVCWLLKFKGYEALTASSGAMGLLTAASFKPHVVFLDLSMPIMDGFEVARRMRADKALFQPLLVAFTAWSDEDTKSRVVKAGFDLHLVKTAPFKALLEVIGKVGASAPTVDGGEDAASR